MPAPRIEKGPPAPSSDNAEAAQLVYSAYTALQMHALDTAQSMLDRARTINPEQSSLWAEYGYLAALQGRVPESVADYKKELSLHPGTAGTYRALTETYLRLGQTANAEEMLRKWAASDTTNPLPSASLVGVLMEEGKAAEAVSTGQAAIAKLPDDHKKDEALRYALGRAQMAAGMKDQARATLVSVLQETQNPGMMNNCAYELGDAGEELPLAESKTRAALEKMDAESKTWKLDANPEMSRAKSRLIYETWDTLGWILYREGKLGQSEGYLKAAWMNKQSPAVAEHLGELEEAQGNKNAALHTFELGLATVSHSNGMGMRKTTPSADETKLQKRVDALKKAGAKSSGKTPIQALQDMRTFSLGARHGISGSGQYWLLLADGAVGQAKATGADDVHGGTERVEKMKFPGFWPPGSTANLVTKGILFCGINGCQFVLE